MSHNTANEFSPRWWMWLIFTGTMLACCCSVKFVGLFVVLLVGLITIADLWDILGDMSKPVVSTNQFYLNFLCSIFHYLQVQENETLIIFEFYFTMTTYEQVTHASDVWVRP